MSACECQKLNSCLLLVLVLLYWNNKSYKCYNYPTVTHHLQTKILTFD